MRYRRAFSSPARSISRVMCWLPTARCRNESLMRFAAIADIHGNYLALEAVLADIRVLGIDAIVNLGDMVSGPLDARRTMDVLKALDAVHLLGNHDRHLTARPREKRGS